MSIEGGSAHYKVEGGVEPLELIESQELGFHLGNVVKYAVRAEYYCKRWLSKPGVTKSVSTDNHIASLEAINKAIWYLERYREIYL